MAGIINPSYRSGFAAPTRLRNYAYPSLWRGCVGAWCPSLGATGSRLFDQSGFGNHGTLTNMDAASDWVVSGSGTALDFDGVDDQVNLASLFSLGPSYSISIWQRPAIVTGTRCLIAQRASQPILFQFDNVGAAPRFIVRDASGNIINITSVFGIAALTWTHVAAIREGTTARVFINSVQSASGSNASLPSSIANTGMTLLIGRNPFAGLETCQGQLDDIRIYNRALTLPEIQLLSRRRGIAYEMDDEVYKFPSAAFQAAWAMNSNVLLGV